MTSLKCHYLIFTNFYVCYFHSFCYNFKASGKKLHLFTLFFNHQSLLQLIFGRLLKHASASPFKATLTRSHSSDKCFHRAGGDLICLFCIGATHFQCIVGVQQEMLCLTVCTNWLIWRLWRQSLSPCMTATPWSRVNWKICDENSTFACFDAICTQFSVTWPHCDNVHDFLAVLTDPACRQWHLFTSWIGFFTARWQWQHVRAARARSSKQNTRANISVFCLHWIAGYNRF